jgi:hypothetical protein
MIQGARPAGRIMRYELTEWAAIKTFPWSLRRSDGKEAVSHARAELPLSQPPGSWMPQEFDVITRKMLEPGSAGLMLAVQEVVREAVGGNDSDRVKFNPAVGRRARRRTKQAERSVPGAS